MISTLKALLPEYEIKRIAPGNYTEILEVYDTNEDYFILADGEGATAETCLNDIGEIPPSFDKDKKLFLGFFMDGKAVAVLDVLESYPFETSCWIGFLLIHGNFHGKGLGRTIGEAAAKAAAASGFSSLQLGVLATNEAAVLFWQRLGFSQIRVSTVKRDGKPDWEVIVMEKSLVDFNQR